MEITFHVSPVISVLMEAILSFEQECSILKEITVTLHIDEDVLMNITKDTGVHTLDEAISQELGWLHDSGMSVETWSYREPEIERVPQLSTEETSELSNTKILYLYRDADNYKMMNECVIEGVLSKEQLQVILDCLQDGEFFIPSQVGLPEKRFGEITESDHCWFELNAYSFLATPDAPTVDLSAEALVQAFCDRKNRWDDTMQWDNELETEPWLSHQNIYDMGSEVTRPSLSDQIQSKANCSIRSQSDVKTSLKVHDTER